MGWLTNLLKKALAQAATEVLIPQIETRMRLIIREEMRQQFEEVWSRFQAMRREEMRQRFEKELLGEVRSLRSEVERIKVHVGLTCESEKADRSMR